MCLCLKNYQTPNGGKNRSCIFGRNTQLPGILCGLGEFSTACQISVKAEQGNIISNVKITIPMSFRNCAGRKCIVTQELNCNFNEPIITNLARAFRWQAFIDSGKFSNVHELARAIGKDDGYVSRIIRLTLLSPEIIHAIIAGTLEKDIGIEQLKQAMPLMWDDQKKMFGME